MSVEVPSRVGPDGTADKLALLYAEAQRCAKLPGMQTLALNICEAAGYSAQSCVEAIEEWAQKNQPTNSGVSRSRDFAFVQAIEAWAALRKYRHEPGDDLRLPEFVRHVGGDCDDLTLLVGALLLALGIPFQPQIVADDRCVAFHVRAVAGLPPGRPTEGYVIDPVYWTEREWNRPPQIPDGRRTRWNG